MPKRLIGPMVAVHDFTHAMFLEIGPLLPLVATFVQPALVPVGPAGLVPGLSTERVDCVDFGSDCSVASEKLRVSIPVPSAFLDALSKVFLLEIG